MEPVHDIRLLLALLAPLVGAGLVMATGKRPNTRETCSFFAAATLFVITASLIPEVFAGKRFYFCLFPLLKGASIALRADALSMVFAVSASFLWVVTVFYSAGYMRGLREHEQTRFNTCFALALFGAIGCAFSDNLLTLYLFYEVVSITTYPLVAHHQDEESYQSGTKYLAYLTGAAKGLILPAMVVIYVLTGNLDFANNINTGILPPDVNRWVTTALYACCILGFAKNGVMPFHNWLPSAMVAPTPVSALLHAVAVVKVGVFSTVRVMLYVFGVDTMQALNLGIPTAYFVSITILVASIVALSKEIADKPTFQIELRIARPNGEIRYCICAGALTRDAAGHVTRVSGVTIDITERKQAEERQMLLAREVDHRARNALAVVQAIVRLTRAATAPSYVAAVEGRIRALSQAHTLLSQSRWEGADIARLIDEELAPYRNGTGARVKLTGHTIFLEPDKAQTLALALHELATNSAKYGALSSADGALDLSWQSEASIVTVHWRETGGPPVRAPTEHGFGTKIINASIKHQMGGDVMLDWRPEGLHCTLSIPCAGKGGQVQPLPSGRRAEHRFRASRRRYGGGRAARQKDRRSGPGLWPAYHGFSAGARQPRRWLRRSEVSRQDCEALRRRPADLHAGQGTQARDHSRTGLPGGNIQIHVHEAGNLRLLL